VLLLGVALVISTVKLPGQPADGERLKIERERALAFTMSRRPPPAEIVGSCLPAPTAVDCRFVRTATRTRLHIRVSAGGASWRVIVRDLTDMRMFETIEAGSARVRSGEFWTDELPAGARVHLLGAPGASLVIDEYAVEIIPAESQAQVGVDGKIEIGRGPANVQGWGRSVARLRFMTIGGQANCTGFLVSSNLVMTNQHCVNTDQEAASAFADFGYDSAAATPDVVAVAKLEDSNVDLDYSVLRLEGAPGAKWGHLALQPEPAMGDRRDLVVVQHPIGGPKKASIEGCDVRGPRLVGVGPNETDFGHGCDTLNGSSGSPVMDLITGGVVGLHHFGYTKDSAKLVNQAVRLELILQSLKPTLCQEITGKVCQSTP
jgi:hypothetical protein